jgi:hypothetical protein
LLRVTDFKGIGELKRKLIITKALSAGDVFAQTSQHFHSDAHLQNGIATGHLTEPHNLERSSTVELLDRVANGDIAQW